MFINSAEFFLPLILLIILFWLIRTFKGVLLWLYIWQLKEYHIGRFLDYLQTYKGKKIISSKLLFFKIAFLFTIIIAYYVNLNVETVLLADISSRIILYALPAILLVYILELGKLVRDLVRGTFKRPTFTKKTLFLIFILTAITFLYLFFFNLIPELLPQDIVIRFLVFDILVPLIVSFVVLFFQPFTFLARSIILFRAKIKRRKLKKLLVIGITGSYGKTSTKEFLATILSEKFKVLKTREHQNAEIGIAQCILKELTPKHKIFICEMGAYNRGGIKMLCNIAQPNIGILTGINEQHMATYGSQENIIKTKYELIESLPASGLAVFNGSNYYCLELYRKTIIPRRLYGFQASINRIPSDLWVHNIDAQKDFISFRVFSKDGGSANFKVNLSGSHNVINILGAIIIAKELGMTLEEIAKACQKIEPWQGGFRLKKGTNNLNVVDATYSANPDGVISHLEYLKTWSEKKIIVMPCLIELGKSATEVHTRIGKKIGEVCDLAIITTRDNFKDLRDGALGSGMKLENIILMENPHKIFEKIKEFTGPGDVVLLESRVPKELIKNLVVWIF